jgi:hypothetical protein
MNTVLTCCYPQKRMNCLLIEDEPLAMLRLREYVQRVPFLTFRFAVDNGLEAIPILQREPIQQTLIPVSDTYRDRFYQAIGRAG